MPPDPTTPDHAAIQAHIDETLKVCDAATFQGNVKNSCEFVQRCEAMQAFKVHAREMLPRYARALEEACKRARIAFQADARLRQTGMLPRVLVLFDEEICRVLNGESEGSVPDAMTDERLAEIKKAIHLYNPKLIDELIGVIDRLRGWVNDLQLGMYINCVYCGHRYGLRNEVPTSMADVLKQHIEQCPSHPMSALKAELERLKAEAKR